MEQGFYCPHCQARLSDPENTVVRMAARLKGPHFAVRATIELSTKLGEYGGRFTDAEVEIERGLEAEFSCPQCRKSFTAEYDGRFAEINMVDAEGKPCAVVFNRILGEQCTFVIDRADKKIVERYGRDAERFYEDLIKFASPRWYI